MIKKGDIVEIVHGEFRASYGDIIGKIGVVRTIRTIYNADSNSDDPIFYVEIDGIRNQNQTNGWWVFKNETSLMNRMEQGWVFCATNEPREPKITIKKENKTMEILEFYKDVKKGEIRRKKIKALEKLKSKHPVINAVKNFADMMKDVKGFVFNWDFDWDEDKEFYKKIEETSNRYDKQMAELDANHREIKALLTDCETYEQKQNILKAYGVIDEHGKLRK